MDDRHVLTASVAAIVNIVIVLLLAPLLEGTVRKLRAIVHSRKGPPLTQPYLDILKLLGKEDLRVTNNWILSVAPVAFLAALLVATAVAPLLPGYTGGFGGDVLVFVYFISLSAVALVLTGLATGSPYAAVGATREVALLLVAEPVLAICLLVVSLNAGSLSFKAIVDHQLAAGGSLSTVVAAIALLLVLQVQVAKLPFDMAEAESELMGGLLTEVSGPKLALCKWGMYLKQYLYPGLLIQVFIPASVWWMPVPVLRPVLGIAYVFVLNLVAVGVVDAVNPRLRVDQALRYVGGIIVVALVALAYAAMGT
jgi:formate hydrogenlyase subunit 4